MLLVKGFLPEDFVTLLIRPDGYCYCQQAWQTRRPRARFWAPGSRLWAQRQKSLVVPAKAVGGLVRAQLVVVVVAVPADGLVGLSSP